jgi:hypothetical protein
MWLLGHVLGTFVMNRVRFINEPLAHDNSERNKVEDNAHIKTSQNGVEVLHEEEVAWSVFKWLVELRSVLRNRFFVGKFLDKIFLRQGLVVHLGNLHDHMKCNEMHNCVQNIGLHSQENNIHAFAE